MKAGMNIQKAQTALKVDVKALSKENKFRGKILFYELKRCVYCKNLIFCEE